MLFENCSIDHVFRPPMHFSIKNESLCNTRRTEHTSHEN